MAINMNCRLRDINLNVVDLSKSIDFYRHILQPFQSVDAEPTFALFRFKFNKQGVLTLNAASNRKKIEKGNVWDESHAILPSTRSSKCVSLHSRVSRALHSVDRIHRL